jgi:hypothetical protein
MFPKSLVLFGAAAAMFVGSASASIAGPVGSGLASTEDQARRHYRERTLKVTPVKAAAASACLTG